MTGSAAERFARVIIEMAPYADEIVFVGGWVHALYLAEANETGAIHTDDVDITIPRELLANDRPTLLELAERAGFERDPISEMDEVPPWMVYRNALGETVPVDFLAEGALGVAVPIKGQPGMLAQGYRGQDILLHHTRPMLVGASIHELLEPARTIRVPTLGAYVLQKGISSSTRTQPSKEAKDLVYIYEIVRHPTLGAQAMSQLRELRERYPDESSLWKHALTRAIATPATMRNVTDELMFTGRTPVAPEDTSRSVSVWLRRLVAESEAIDAE